MLLFTKGSPDTCSSEPSPAYCNDPIMTGVLTLLLLALSACQAILYSSDKLNVHVVPHTHDDTGWQVTVDQYYYQEVQYIIDTVVEELQKDPSRRFIYVEIAFFRRWWLEQSQETQQVVRELVTNGSLEFINGGWCMNDEAGTHYNAIIDQMTEGFLFLKREFGESGRPRIGWHIDPFGHSSIQAALFAQMAFDGFFFSRIDYQDLAKRTQERTLEMIWRGSVSLGAEADMFTGVLYHGTYGPPSGFDFSNGNDIQDDLRLEDYNVVEKLAKFANETFTQNKSYVGNHIMLTMGSDFQYKNAHRWYKNLDKLIHYANTNESLKLNAFYSTPSIYVDAKNSLNASWTLKTDDFLPHSSKPHSYWSGFFTSRPSLKGYSRWANNWLQICKQLEAIAGPNDNTSESLRLALGVLQHHDAITGTERQAVTYDYQLRISKGSDSCALLASNSLRKLAEKGAVSMPEINYCFLTNVSVCSATEKAESFAVIVYNPLARENTWPVRLPVSGNQYIVKGPKMEAVESAVLQLSTETMRVRAKRGNTSHELVFLATAPPLGYSTYFVQLQQNSTPPAAPEKPEGDFSISNSMVTLTFDGISGRLKLFGTYMDGFTHNLPLKQELRWYNASAGNNKVSSQASGPYVFRPNSSERYDLADGRPYGNEVYKTEVVQEVRQTVHEGIASQVIRLYKDSPFAEIEFTVGPIPIQDGWGKEIIDVFSSEMKSEKLFYTDANGREMQTRERFHRNTYTINLTEPVASNYFPVNSRIAIQDIEADLQLTVLTDRSQGGSSMEDGEMELMVHRRLLYDDHFGAGEPLSEPGLDGKGLIIRGSHYVLVAPIKKSAYLHRQLGERIFMKPFAGIASMKGMTPQKWADSFNVVYSGMKMPLPENVHLLTLQREPEGLLVRLDHQYSVGEDPYFSKPVEVPALDDIFSAFQVNTVEEMILGANLPKKEENRLKWNVTGERPYTEDKRKEIVSSPDQKIDLNPMDIRTFLVDVKGE
eukprot:m.122439 g.122439  ORF g.122439 m.122439 type:complete len:993 (+) comp37781_c0_seq1:117-3095(+)